MGRRCSELVQRLALLFGYRICRAEPQVKEQRAAPAQSGAIPASNTLALTLSDVLLRIVLSGGSSSDFIFVQIGANDGVSNDPIRRFVLKYGFKGVLVEPQPEVFARLRRNYAGVVGVAFENAAVGGEDGELKMYRFKKTETLPGWADGLASFSKETLVANLQNIRAEVEEIAVPTLTFQSLLQKHGLQHVDLLQIDAEGFDFEVIKMINFTTLKPTIIHFEQGLLSQEEREECFRYLTSQGYKITNNVDNTVAYLEPKEQSLPGKDWYEALPEEDKILVSASV